MAEHSNHLISVKDLSFSYPGRENILNGFSFSLHEGEKTAFIGSTGCGKSTFLKLIMGLLPPQEGTIELFSRPVVSEKDFKGIRTRIGFLFQNAEDQLFSPTVIEDVAFGPLNQGKTKDEALAISKETLSFIGLEDFEDRVTYKLSGGEKKLVALASILSMKPEILLLDEPVTGLDKDAKDKIIECIKKVDIPSVIVSHDWDFLEQITDSIYVIENGKCSPGGKGLLLHKHAHLHPLGDVDHEHSKSLNP